MEGLEGVGARGAKRGGDRRHKGQQARKGNGEGVNTAGSLTNGKHERHPYHQHCTLHDRHTRTQRTHPSAIFRASASILSPVSPSSSNSYSESGSAGAR